ncbi:hypothetical protein NPIL_325431 [Nephila pilipes]|uniref:Uncharacterized protein n=1 Tax=Nephila pilipes TaxID=299642 RepID=A0A8X6MUI0_NEPPI|nr:hypothetical protein NPIL_325431 [Nephila pilipes]
MLSYFRSDVDILLRCCIVFRKQFMEIANVHPFRYTDTMKKIKQFISIRAVSSMDALYASTETPCIR